MKQSRETATTKLSVPDYMHTSVLVPRVISLLFVIIWVITFAYGTKALALKEFSRADHFRDILEIGTKHWSVTKITDPSLCVGYLQTTLTQSPNLILTLIGELALNTGLTRGIVRTNIEARFTERYLMSSARGDFEFNNSRVHFSNDGLSDRDFLITIKTPHIEKQFNFRLPQQIFLVNTTGQRYSIHLPDQLNLINATMDSNTSFSSLSGVNFIEAADKETVICRGKDVLEALNSNNSVLFDVHSILQLLRPYTFKNVRDSSG